MDLILRLIRIAATSERRLSATDARRSARPAYESALTIVRRPEALGASPGRFSAP